METQEKINITPSPRILRMLGEIDFKAWQCLCEIIDNSIDAFSTTDINLGNKKQPIIKITLPGSKTDVKPSDTITVEDNAEGMTLTSLENSFKAGFSANNPVDKMGLFGMGFNIATARLGLKTEIITATKNSTEKLSVTIDFKELEKSGTYEIPVVRTQKRADEIDWHGTIINITQLRIEHVKPLYQRKRIGTKLGKIYGRVLRDKNIKITYQGTTCKPFTHCKWDDSRQGQSTFGKVPAVIKIDKLIDVKRYCNTCWIWLNDADNCCPACNKTTALTKRERRVKGWIGVQRYFHAQHFGFDLIRNGRVIVELDKSFFSMLNDQEELELEYPVDGQQAMGRFIGELEIDFVKVTHQKDAFDINTNDWKDVVKAVRGDSPIRPRLAKNLGYGQNDSPLAQLFSAFRNAKKGIPNLVPGRANGGAMLNDAVLDEYLVRFKQGETDYQNDSKWWDLVTAGNNHIGSLNDENDPTGGSPFASRPDKTSTARFSDETVTTITPDPSRTDETAKVSSQQDTTKPDRFLSGSYSLDIFKNVTIRVIAQMTESSMGVNGFQVKPKGNELTFTYWPDDPVFNENLLQPADFLINELAYHIHQIAHNELARVPLSAVELALREKYFPELQPTCEELKRSVKILTDDLRVHLRSKSETTFNTSSIDSADMSNLRKRLGQNEKLNESEITAAIQKGEFLTYASFSMMRCIITADPNLVFDGKFFNQSWSNVEMSSTYHNADFHELSSLLTDVEWFDENHMYPQGSLWRARVKRLIGTLEIITSWRV